MTAESQILTKPRSPAEIRQIRATTCEKQSNSARAAGLRIFAFCILLFDFFPPLQAYARTKQHLLCKTKPISGGLLMTVTSAITSTYEEKPPLRPQKNKANSKPIGKKAATLAKLHQIRATRYEIRDTILRAYKAPLAGVPPLHATRAHKTTPFMQNKANFRRADNDRNLSSNKHLREQTTPGGPKKQSQFQTQPPLPRLLSIRQNQRVVTPRSRANGPQERSSQTGSLGSRNRRRRIPGAVMEAQ